LFNKSLIFYKGNIYTKLSSFDFAGHLFYTILKIRHIYRYFTTTTHILSDISAIGCCLKLKINDHLKQKMAYSYENSDNISHLIRFPNISEVKASCAVGRVGCDSGDPAFVTLPAVCRIALVPDVDRDVLTLLSIKYFTNWTLLARIGFALNTCTRRMHSVQVTDILMKSKHGWGVNPSPLSFTTYNNQCIRVVLEFYRVSYAWYIVPSTDRYLGKACLSTRNEYIPHDMTGLRYMLQYFRILRITYEITTY
jgi:hypothetical protein